MKKIVKEKVIKELVALKVSPKDFFEFLYSKDKELPGMFINAFMSRRKQLEESISLQKFFQKTDPKDWVIAAFQWMGTGSFSMWDRTDTAWKEFLDKEGEGLTAVCVTVEEIEGVEEWI